MIPVVTEDQAKQLRQAIWKQDRDKVNKVRIEPGDGPEDRAVEVILKVRNDQGHCERKRFTKPLCLAADVMEEGALAAALASLEPKRKFDRLLEGEDLV